MSTKQQHTIKPFPIEKFDKLQVTDDNFIIGGMKVVGYMHDPFPTDIEDMEIESDEIEDLIKRGYIYPGYEHWFVNKFGLPVETFDIDGYPEGTVTRDMWNYYYFKDICIGVKLHDGIAAVEEEEIERLEEYGIESSHLYGIEQKPKVYTKPTIHHNFREIIAYKIHPTSTKIKVDDHVWITHDNTIDGQLVNDKIIKLSDELIAKYIKLGCKMASDELIKASTV